MIADGRYLAAKTVSDVWICYPWEATYVFLSNFPNLPYTTPTLSLSRFCHVPSYIF